jgi:hypothetical protein
VERNSCITSTIELHGTSACPAVDVGHGRGVPDFRLAA